MMISFILNYKEFFSILNSWKNSGNWGKINAIAISFGRGKRIIFRKFFNNGISAKKDIILEHIFTSSFSVLSDVPNLKSTRFVFQFFEILPHLKTFKIDENETISFSIEENAISLSIGSVNWKTRLTNEYDKELHERMFSLDSEVFSAYDEKRNEELQNFAPLMNFFNTFIKHTDKYIIGETPDYGMLLLKPNGLFYGLSGAHLKFYGNIPLLSYVTKRIKQQFPTKYRKSEKYFKYYFGSVKDVVYFQHEVPDRIIGFPPQLTSLNITPIIQDILKKEVGTSFIKYNPKHRIFTFHSYLKDDKNIFKIEKKFKTAGKIKKIVFFKENSYIIEYDNKLLGGILYDKR